MFDIFTPILEELQLMLLCLQSAVGYWVDDETMPEGVRHVKNFDYYDFRPSTIYPENAEYAKFLNGLSVRHLSIGGRYVLCGYGYNCGKWLFLSYGEEDRPTHPIHSDVWGCGDCADRAYKEEFGEDPQSYYDRHDPWYDDNIEF